eukprot:1082107-Rhodomonas_salina.2
MPALCEAAFASCVLTRAAGAGVCIPVRWLGGRIEQRGHVAMAAHEGEFSPFPPASQPQQRTQTC